MKNKYILSLLSFSIFCFILFLSFDLIKEIINLFTQLLSNNQYKYLFVTLFSIIIVLWFWLIYFFINLKKTNNKLNFTLNELNFQKMALDEHAIVSMTDVKGNITYVNDKFCEISGYSIDELIGKNHRIVKSNEHPKEFFDSLKKTIQNGEIWNGEVKNKKKNGDFYWVRATIMPFLDLNKKPFKYVSIRTDITEVKKIQEELIKAKNIAVQSNRIKSDFLANMSHELKTPLNSINIISSVMIKNKNKKLDNEQIKNLNIINRCGKDLLFLINDVLDISKLDAGEINIECEEFDFKNFIYNIKEMFINQIEEKNLSFNIKYDEKISTIYNDELRIKQIIVNLLSNAIKFTNDGEISLIIKDEKEYILLEVIDEGIGIEENKLNYIFDRFKQVDGTTTRKYGGTGLGLAISKELAILLHGEIQVESEVNKGTKFIFKFEKNIDLNKNIKKKENSVNNDFDYIEHEEACTKFSQLNILILNDNPLSLFNIFVELKRKAKSVDLVNNIDEFLNKINESNYDKVIINLSSKIDFKDKYISTYSKELYFICNNNYKLTDMMKEKAKIIFYEPFSKENFLKDLH